MSDRLEEAEFWLPSEFLTDEDILMDNKENLNAELCFPTEFPYDVDSVVNYTDEEDQLAELTRQLSLQHTRNPGFEKSGRVMAGSPQSTLVRLGSWAGRSPLSSNGGSSSGPSQVSSPPTSPLGGNNDAWDLIHQAARQVAELKINGGDPSLAKNRAFLHHRPSCPLKNTDDAFINAYVQQVREEQMLRQQQQQRCAMWSNKQHRNGCNYEQPPPQQQHVVQRRGIRFGGPYMESEECGRGQAAWPSLQYVQPQNQQRRSAATGPVLLGGSGGGSKKQCAGTGVFLPRRYVNNSSNNNSSNYDTRAAECRKRPGCSPALIPARVVQALNRNLIDMNGGLGQPLCPARLDGYVPDYEMLIARRNALLMLQQSRNLRVQGSFNSHELSLPQEWTY